MKAYETIFEDGTLGYDNNPWTSNSKTSSDGAVNPVERREVETTPEALAETMERSRFMVGEKHGDSYEIRERSLDEMVTKNLLDEREAERIFQIRERDKREGNPKRIKSVPENGKVE